MTGEPARWPGESPEYRAAREDLLAAEHDLSRAIERVAVLRRALPIGGVVPVDFAFREGPREIGLEGPETEVMMGELFGEHATLHADRRCTGATR